MPGHHGIALGSLPLAPQPRLKSSVERLRGCREVCPLLQLMDRLYPSPEAVVPLVDGERRLPACRRDDLGTPKKVSARGRLNLHTPF